VFTTLAGAENALSRASVRGQSAEMWLAQLDPMPDGVSRRAASGIRPSPWRTTAARRGSTRRSGRFRGPSSVLQEVARAPPLSPEQLARLGSLFGNGERR